MPRGPVKAAFERGIANEVDHRLLFGGRRFWRT